MAAQMKRVALVVDDNRMVVRVFSRMLEELGFDVLYASDGQNALDLLAALDASIFDRMSIIFSDVDMPRMAGPTLLEQIRIEHELVTIPFVFYSANTNLSEVLKALAVRPDDLLMKPISQQRLAECLANFGL